MRRNIEIESNCMVISVYSESGADAKLVFDAQACTHGGWALYDHRYNDGVDSPCVYIADRSEVFKYLKKLFPTATIL